MLAQSAVDFSPGRRDSTIPVARCVKLFAKRE